MHPFRNLLAALILFQHNVKILHWNLVGVDFDPVHQLLGDYYDQLGEFIDDIAETSIQLEIPPVGLTEAFDILNGLNDDFVALEGKEIFTSEESFNSLGIMFEKLLSLYETAWNGDGVPADVANKLQEHAFWIRKQYKFKNARRLQK